MQGFRHNREGIIVKFRRKKTLYERTLHNHSPGTAVVVVTFSHGTSLQKSTPLSTPGQSLPPCEGGGLSHSRVRVLIPASHVALQPVQAAHGPQLPSTGGSDVKKRQTG